MYNSSFYDWCRNIIPDNKTIEPNKSDHHINVRFSKGVRVWMWVILLFHTLTPLRNDTIDDPLVGMRINKASNFDRNLIIHYTHEAWLATYKNLDASVNEVKKKEVVKLQLNSTASSQQWVKLILFSVDEGF